ncbi:PREDICTED: uncharacterized protein LOC107344830 isoform X4 [Acropora digitifera]|uniref:uncharacterized protein LOC107344830 isoform X4 n=1 Tax=Acropora digitifera TaxID=70779 RepID=UPI00077A82ED|nr:PREDICTED: uncharacterized protein LOC107344830 isoform X4 [Acropora digitifera]
MDFKALVLFFALFAAVASGASVCRCAEEEKKEAPVEKYTLKVDDGIKQIEETVEIDTEKETEVFEIPSDGDISPSAPGDVKIVYDFKQNLAMTRLSNQKACFLKNSTSDLPKPSDLKDLLDKKKTNSPTDETFQYTVVGTLNDRSILSDDMANMCAKYPIYLIKERSPLSAELEKKEEIKRTKRSPCSTVYVKQCYAPNSCYWHIILYCLWGDNVMSHMHFVFQTRSPVT